MLLFQAKTICFYFHTASKRTILGDLLRRGNRRKSSVTAAEKQKLNTIREAGLVSVGSTSAQYEFLRNKNAVYCAVVFEEFLKELAALAQEHAVSYLGD